MAHAVLAIAFDLEGTLVDLEALHHSAHLAAAGELGLSLTLESARQRIRSFIGGPDRAVAASLRELSDRAKPVEEIEERIRWHYEHLRATHVIEVRPGLVDFLKAVRLRGLPMALGSVTSRAVGNALVTEAGLDDFFPARRRVFLEDVQAPKPDPTVYIETARRLDVRPEQQLVFEDSPLGIAAARAAGSVVIAIPAFDADTLGPQLMAAGAIAVFREWNQLTLGTALKVVGRLH